MTKSLVQIYAIVAMDQSRVIGAKGGLPWRIPEDLKHFAELTAGGTVLMGRKTFESLPDKYRPLPGRTNVVVTRNPDRFSDAEGVEAISDLAAYVDDVRNDRRRIQGETLWIIGGGQIYEKTIHLWDGVEMTLVKGEYAGDTYFPHFESGFDLIASQDFKNFSFFTYRRKS